MSNRYEKAKQYAEELMSNGLNEKFHYHNLEHVYDVLESAIRIAELEGVSEQDQELLKTAVMFHDAGYTKGLKDHEALGCIIVQDNLPGFGYSEKEIETICGLIMATKVPQNPSNKLEEIICDADLDYLGRSDFFSVGDNLYKEFLEYGFIKGDNEWQELQQSFLENHKYFTRSAKETRHAQKAENLVRVKQKINSK